MAGYHYEYSHRDNPDKWSAPNFNWTKPSYDVPDHVCKPVIIDAEGRKRPIVSYSPPNSHSHEGHYKEKIVEHIHYKETRPVIQEHKIHQHQTIDPHVEKIYKDESYKSPVVHLYKVHQHANGENYKDDSHSRPVIHQYKIHPHANSEHYRDDTHTRPHHHHGNFEKYKEDSHPKPVIQQYKLHPHANGEHYKDDTYTKPHHKHSEFEDYKDDNYKMPISHEHKIHPHAKPDPYVETYKESNYARPHHSIYPQNNNNEHFYHIPHAKKDHYNDHDRDHHSFHKPSSPESHRPGKFGLLSATHWRNMPHQHHGSREEVKLSGATNNIGEAMMMLKEAAKPVVYGLKESTDSREAARRYGNSSSPSRMHGGEYGHHGPAISSRDAAKKYSDSHVFPG